LPSAVFVRSLNTTFFCSSIPLFFPDESSPGVEFLYSRSKPGDEESKTNFQNHFLEANVNRLSEFEHLQYLSVRFIPGISYKEITFF
jgi:hypothetical protein